MIHYHGLPITPESSARKAVEVGHAFVSYAYPSQLGVAIEVCQSFAVDNGAFSAWKKCQPIQDWTGYYEWVSKCKLLPSCDFAVIPDVIDGSEDDNDALLSEWSFPNWFGAPVWHMHESFNRLDRLASSWPRVCIGSSGEFSTQGNQLWWERMEQAMRVVCNTNGQPFIKLHGLRMLNPKIFTRIPLSSADSTNIARNIGIDKRWKGTYTPPTKDMRASVMRSRIESYNSPMAWVPEGNDLQQMFNWGIS